MIQRIQSLWFFTAFICTLLTLKFPFYTGYHLPAEATGIIIELNAKSNIILLLLSFVIAAKCFLLIFLYKYRNFQFGLTVGAIAFSIIFILGLFVELKKIANGHLSLTSLFAFAIPFFLLLAARGIWKDMQLLKTTSRMR